MKNEQSVKDYLQRAISFHNFILERYPNGTYKSDRRNTLFVSLCDLVLEHFGAIISLVKSGQHTGSAFALLRPLIETSIRAYWVRYIADDGLLVSILRYKAVFPVMEQAAKQVEKYFTKQSYPGMFSIKRDTLRQLHGFTHSGLEQLQFRFGTDLAVKPTYPDSAVCNLIREASMWTAMAAIAQLILVEGEDKPESDRFSKRYVELFGN
jgi:hypothetical protein